MKRTDQTLVEQMKFSDVEIANRLELMALSKAELNLLASYKDLIEQNIDLIVEEFYEKQTEIDEISLLIGDMDTLRRLENAQRKYVMDLFSGHYDAEYVNNRLRIGMVHKRIGVEPKLYLSAIIALKRILIRPLKNGIDDRVELDKVLGILDRLIYFDITLVFDTYIDSLVGEIETAKRRTESYAKSLEEKVAERTRQLEEQAKLDPLTNVYNQRALQEMLRHELAQSKRRQSHLSMIYFDIDKFKQINDKEGHIRGDEVLRHVGVIMLKIVREVDIPCRYGGDEFCIVLPDCKAENATKVCEKIIAEFKSRFPDYSLSLGIAESSPEHPMDSAELIKAADAMMYRSKEQKGFAINL